MDNRIRTAGNLTTTAWRRELSLAAMGRGYRIGLRNIALAELVTVSCTDMAISAAADRTGHTVYTLTASNTQQSGALAHFAITVDEATRIAEWLGLDMPQPLALEQARA